MEYFSQWVFVMCAIRGGSFCDSARGTCALFACAGMKAIIGDLLIDRVVTLGCLLAALGGMGLAAFAAFTSASRTDVIGLCAVLGLFSALISSGGVMAVPEQWDQGNLDVLGRGSRSPASTWLRGFACRAQVQSHSRVLVSSVVARRTPRQAPGETNLVRQALIALLPIAPSRLSRICSIGAAGVRSVFPWVAT